MEISELRETIDGIDSQIVALYKRRMAAVAAIGAYKRARGLPICDAARERDLLNKVCEQAGEAYESDVRALFSTIMALSRAHQARAPK